MNSSMDCSKFNSTNSISDLSSSQNSEVSPDKGLDERLKKLIKESAMWPHLKRVIKKLDDSESLKQDLKESLFFVVDQEFQQTPSKSNPNDQVSLISKIKNRLRNKGHPYLKSSKTTPKLSSVGMRGETSSFYSEFGVSPQFFGRAKRKINFATANSPGPAHYSPSFTSLSTKHGISFAASKSPKSDFLKHFDTPGPGYYSPSGHYSSR